ncbi:hypothetical protein EHQ52_05695 [Leptospira koniambonensis]|uniref:Uncharacterized protein n=1 Tax=Leptospira koniambonensis TaxID=2484950 RepID=A0A4R9J5T1_9LEPT|nr:thrombospondin type 3 repeat-containing protein [Leptospira koniambonensis]TGL34017.1 hypothetical protein EHQ52_05695 [Leptospira koniambonensis]
MPKAIPASELRISEDSNVPKLVGRSQVPVGKIYDISLATRDKDGKEQSKARNSSIVFSEPVKFEFPVDLEALEEKGFSQELYVWYKDYVTKEWKLLEKGSLDKEKSIVTVHTKHFTPFILTALPVLPDSGVAAPTACLSDESVAWGMQGVLDDSNVSKAQVGTIGEGYQYYLDRPYFVKENEGAFRELGLQFAALVPSCQGGAGTCGVSSIHADSTASEYVSFNAVRDIDVYVMYDSRGGISPSDSSNDADWLRTDFTLLSGKYIYTTEPGLDPAQNIGASGYKVYKRSYLQGARVVLGGNKKGTVGGGVSSNFWAVVKPKNTEGTVVSSGVLCSTGPDLRTSNPVTLKSFPGSNQNLFWFAYEDTYAPRNIIIRRSQIAPPMAPTQGDEVSASEITSYSYLDSGLTIDTTYYYSVFALNNDGIFNGISTGSITTSVDTDGDGLSDITESSTPIRPLFIAGASNTFSSSVNTDSDGDGTSDFTELSLGTDPTMADTVLPNATFTLLSDNASSSFVDFTASVSDTNPAGSVKKYCYIRQFEAGMTNTEFERKPFGALNFGPPSSSLFNVWKENCFESKTFVQLGKAAGGLEKIAIWAKDGAGNVSNIKKYDFKQLEAKDASWLGVTNITYDANGNAASSFTDFTYLNYTSQWGDSTWTQKYTNLGLKNQIKFTNGGQGIAYRIPNFFAIGDGNFNYYDNSNVIGSLGTSFSISYDYTDKSDRFKAVSFPANINSNEVNSIAYLNQSYQLQIDTVSVGSFGPEIYGTSFPEVNTNSLFVMPYDRGQGLLVGYDAHQYEFLHSGNYYRNLNTNGLSNPDFNNVISADSLVRYNPQNEQEVFATLKSVPSREIKVWYKKPGDLTYNSIIPSGVQSGTNFIGRQVKFLSYMDWSGNPVYTLYILGGYDVIVGQNTSYTLLRSYRVTFTSGVPTLQFIRESVIGGSPIESISFDGSGRLMFAKGSSQRFVTMFLNSNTGFTDIAFIYNNQSSGPYTHVALSPSDTKGIGNVGGYSKIRLIPNAGISDYKKYGFLPEGATLDFMHNFYDRAGNDCATSSSNPGVGTIEANAGGNYGIPAISLTVNAGTNVNLTRSQSVVAPNQASTLVVQSSFTQGTSPCRDILVSTDKVEIPVRAKTIQATTVVYKDTTMNPTNVPAMMQPASMPTAVANADFKVWEHFSKSTAVRKGTFTGQKWFYLPGWPFPVYEPSPSCVVNDVTYDQGLAACSTMLNGWPFAPGYTAKYDEYTFTGRYVYSGDKLITAP